MTLLERTKAALRSNVSATELPELDNSDPAFAKARDDVERTGLLVQDLQQKHTKLNYALEQDEAQLQKLALAAELSGNNAEYDALKAKVARQEADLLRLQGAVEAASGEDREAQAALHRLGVAGKLKLIKRQSKVYEDLARDVEKNVSGLARSLTALHKHSEKLRFSWPLPGNPPLGHALGTSELQRLLSDEFWRALPANVTDLHRSVTIPGAATSNGKGDPRQFPSFAERVASCMASLISVVERGTVDAAPLQVEAGPAQAEENTSNSADAIMATLPPPKRITIDTRKSKE